MNMTATNHTEHYGLSQYTENDRPTYTGDYNGDMSKIDAAIYAATENIPSLDGYATTESVTQAIASAIADRLTAGDIKSGNGINIETSGNTVTISYVGGGSMGGLAAVAHDGTLTGDGTTSRPLGAAVGSAVNQTYAFAGGAPDLNNLTDFGIFALNNDHHTIANIPTDPFRGCVFVTNNGYPASNKTSICQLALCRNWSNAVEIYTRSLASGSWSAWTRMASMADVANVTTLTSRIATLESQITTLAAAAAPSATGLAATQLDTQYSDNYNIVQVGTPTRSNESEEPHNE